MKGALRLKLCLHIKSHVAAWPNYWLIGWPTALQTSIIDTAISSWPFTHDSLIMLTLLPPTTICINAIYSWWAGPETTAACSDKPWLVKHPESCSHHCLPLLLIIHPMHIIKMIKIKMSCIANNGRRCDTVNRGIMNVSFHLRKWQSLGSLYYRLNTLPGLQHIIFVSIKPVDFIGCASRRGCRGGLLIWLAN